MINECVKNESIFPTVYNMCILWRELWLVNDPLIFFQTTQTFSFSRYDYEQEVILKSI